MIMQDMLQYKNYSTGRETRSKKTESSAELRLEADCEYDDVFDAMYPAAAIIESCFEWVALLLCMFETLREKLLDQQDTCTGAAALTDKRKPKPDPKTKKEKTGRELANQARS